MMVPGKPDCKMMMGLRALLIFVWGLRARSYFLGLHARWLYFLNISGLLGRFIFICFVAYGRIE